MTKDLVGLGGQVQRDLLAGCSLGPPVRAASGKVAKGGQTHVKRQVPLPIPGGVDLLITLLTAAAALTVLGVAHRLGFEAYDAIENKVLQSDSAWGLVICLAASRLLLLIFPFLAVMGFVLLFL